MRERERGRGRGAGGGERGVGEGCGRWVRETGEGEGRRRAHLLLLRQLVLDLVYLALQCRVFQSQLFDHAVDLLQFVLEIPGVGSEQGVNRDAHIYKCKRGQVRRMLQFVLEIPDARIRKSREKTMRTGRESKCIYMRGHVGRRERERERKREKERGRERKREEEIESGETE